MISGQVEISKDIVVVHHHSRPIPRARLLAVIAGALTQSRPFQPGVAPPAEHLARVVTDLLEDHGVEIT